MKLLLIARRLHVNRSSEGICSSKFLQALSTADASIVCLTRDNLTTTPESSDPFSVPWLPGIRLLHSHAFAGRPSRGYQLYQRAATAGRWSRLARKIDTATFYLSGHRLATHREIAIWEQAIATLIARERPDAIIVRAEGTSFDPHLAMVRVNPAVPWIAHYHDPYPSSLYPEPFRAALPLASRAQERGHFEILERCHALSFPSQRLMRWVLRGELSRHRRKAFVLPHLATTLALPADEGQLARSIEPASFTLVHTGALLGPRNPAGLISGFRTFLDRDPTRAAQARLLLIGPMDRAHATGAGWSHLLDTGIVRCLDQRVPYHESLALARRAAVNVVIEASNATESPFLPAKFADYVGVGKPILLLSLTASSVADAMGGDSRLLVSPDDPEAIASAIEMLWNAWRSGSLDSYVPSAAVAQQLSAPVVLDELSRALRFVGVDGELVGGTDGQRRPHVA